MATSLSPRGKQLVVRDKNSVPAIALRTRTLTPSSFRAFFPFRRRTAVQKKKKKNTEMIEKENR